MWGGDSDGGGDSTGGGEGTGGGTGGGGGEGGGGEEGALLNTVPAVIIGTALSLLLSLPLTLVSLCLPCSLNLLSRY